MPALKRCLFLSGNSSSRIFEAPNLNKCVLNIGDRQKGMVQGGNAINSGLNQHEKSKAIDKESRYPKNRL